MIDREKVAVKQHGTKRQGETAFRNGNEEHINVWTVQNVQNKTDTNVATDINRIVLSKKGSKEILRTSLAKNERENCRRLKKVKTTCVD